MFFEKRKNTVFLKGDFPLFYPTVTTNLLLWHLSFSAIQFCFSVILQNLTYHPACQIHPAPFWSHERTCTFRLRSPHPYQDTKLLCLSTFANVKRTYGREKDGSNVRKKEGKGAQNIWKDWYHVQQLWYKYWTHSRSFLFGFKQLKLSHAHLYDEMTDLWVITKLQKHWDRTRVWCI